MIASPIIFLAIYTTVYLYVFKVKSTGLSQFEYILHIFAGLVPFIAIAEAISLGVSSLEANQNLLKNTVFPVELIPSKLVLSTLPGFLVGLLIVLIVSIFNGRSSAALLMLPVLIVLQFMFVQGVSWVLSLINLVLKDLKLIVSYAITVAMITSPIAYTIEMVPAGLRFLVWLNPFAQFILAYQFVIVNGALPPWEVLALTTVMSFLAFFGGYAIFDRLKPVVVTYAG